jgi:hypothetical protein
MTKYPKFLLLFLSAAALLAGCFVQPAPAAPPSPAALEINSFEDCVQAGYPVMESYPRQCRTADGKHFVEQVEATAAPPSGVIEPEEPTPTSPEINSFEGCVQAGNPVMESYPRQCRTADGQNFVEPVEIATAQSGVVEPEDPNQAGLAPYPDEPLASRPAGPLSIKEVIEHRSALNDQTVQVRGMIVATLLGEKACPPDRGACGQPSLFLAETAQPNRDPLYDLQVLVGEAEREADYPLGETIELQVLVRGSKVAVVAQKVE